MDKTQLIDCNNTFCYLDLECMESSLNCKQRLIEEEIQSLNDTLRRVQMTRERVRNTMNDASGKEGGKNGQKEI